MISPTPPPHPGRDDPAGHDARDPGAILPRSATLASWLWAGAPDERSSVSALRILMHDDEPHGLRGDLPAGLASPTLAALFLLWSSRVEAAVALFPGPGDAMGAPAPASAAAIEAEECVLVTVRSPGPRLGDAGRDRALGGGRGGVDGSVGEPDAAPDYAARLPEPGVVEHWALVPDVEPFGSALEQGFFVTWELVRIEAWEHRALGTVGSLSEAERGLQRGLREATEALMELDVSRWRDTAGGAIAALRETVDLRPWLPPTLDPRRSHVFQSAARLRAIVDLATEDDGGAVNLWQADQRSTALREVDRVARHAMAAATLHTPLLP